MEDRFDVVPVRVDDERCVIPGVVVRAKARRAVVTAAGFDSGAVELVNGGSVGCGERHMNGSGRGFPFPDPEISTALDGEPRPLRALHYRHSERLEGPLVEHAAASQVTDSQGQVVDEGKRHRQRHALHPRARSPEDIAQRRARQDPYARVHDYSKVWFITGAGRGMGVDIARAALAAGHAVVATGRNTDTVTDAVGEADELLVVELDVTSPASAEAAVQAALDRFGRIDVLVNNAGNFFAGFFEELSPAQFDQQIATNLGGPLNVTRAVLPAMRKQRSGHIITMSSTAGIAGQAFCSAYAASKFGLEGWMESLRFEIEPFGIDTTIVEPGFFRTDLLTPESTAYADLSIDDYAERTAETRPAWEAMSGKQTNDPAKLAAALVEIVAEDTPPLRFVAGADAVETVEQKANELLAQVDAYRALSTSLAVDET